MNPYSWSHLADRSVLHKLSDHSSQHCGSGAVLVSLVADVDRRKLYLPAGHSSMHSYCRTVLNWSEGSAFKRIRVARAAQEFPVLYRVLADNRVHLSGLVLLAPHLTPENIDELIAAEPLGSELWSESLCSTLRSARCDQEYGFMGFSAAKGQSRGQR